MTPLQLTIIAGLLVAVLLPAIYNAPGPDKRA